MRWLLDESRTPEHILAIIRRWDGGADIARRSKRKAVILAARGAAKTQIQRALDEEKIEYQRANIAYWKPLLHELKAMYRRKKARPRCKV